VTRQRALGIDFGERRIGLALSDPEGRLALPFGTIERDTDRRAVYRIAEIARREGVGRLVLGEPLGLDGTVGEAAQRVHAFGRKLEKATGLPLLWVNEALTTVEATERLREAGLDRRDRPGRRDAVAAQILLQEVLERPTEDTGEAR
jgi:putative Holliday junction resolvase